MLDFAVASTRAAHRLQVSAKLDVPWATHSALEIRLPDATTAWEYDKFVMPAKLPTPARPKRAADPNSKRSRQRARRLLQEAPAALRDALADSLDLDPFQLDGEDQAEEDSILRAD